MLKSKKKEKENLETVQYFYRLLTSRITNKDILEYIMEQIKYGADNNTIAFHNENEIIVREKNFNETFRLTIGDSTIETEEVKWKGRATITKKIEFDGPITTVTEAEHNRITTDNTITSFERVVKVKKYQDDELIYEREFLSRTSSNETSNYANDKETFINKNNAVRKITSIAENEDSMYKTDVEYYKTDGFDAPPFDTSKQTHTVYMYGMSSTTKEEFDAFMTEYNKSYTYKKAQ